MKDIMPIPKEIYDVFEKASPSYLVVGIKKQQLNPQQPSQFRNASFHVGSLDELMVAINQEGMHRFKVFEVNGLFSHEAQLRADAKKAAIEDEELKARKLYEQLKKRFEKEEQHLQTNTAG